MGTERFRGALLSTLIIASLMLLAISLLFISPSSAAPDGLTPRAPIYIYGNDNFTPANGVNGGGSGTVGDPYIIENWDINAENANGIEIRNTTAHFIIRNCLVENAGLRSSSVYHGIFLYNVVNGKIENCTYNNNLRGINLWYSDNNIISNSIAESNYYCGISLESSSNNIISNSIMENNYNWGIHLINSDNNTISNCIMENNIGYGISLSNNSNNNIISNSIVENNIGGGIELRYSSYNTISNCVISVTIDVAGGYNLIFNNLLENSSISLPRVSFDNVRQVVNNNRIYHNNFINTIVGDLNTNYWDDGYPSGGNYWSNYAGADNYRGENQDIPGSDGIGDTPHDIPYGTNRDRYPLMKPFVPEAMLPEEAPSTRWLLIAGIIVVIVIIGIVAALYMRRRKPTEFQW